MLQPTGPHDGAETPEADPPPMRAAAGLDICRETSGVPQAGHFTSSASELRRMSSSKPLPHRVHAYS